MKNQTARAALLAEGLKALIVNGYDGVGINEILNSAGVPKGSFYHFFASKEAFAVAILEVYERHYVTLREQIFQDETLTPINRLLRYFEELEAIHLEEVPLGGCLYGVLAQTVSARSPAFMKRLASVFATWTTQLEALLSEAQWAGEVPADADVQNAAAFLIEAYEGALIRMKVDGDAAAMNRFKRFALGAISARPAMSSVRL